MLKKKVIVITGGAGLLGQEFAKAILKNNGIVIIADFNEEKGLEVNKNLQSLFPKATIEYQLLDINKKESLLHLIDVLDQKYGRIDALINNAYPRNNNYGKPFFEVSYEDFIDNVGMNLGGYFVCSQNFSRYFIKQGHGNIINISSIYGVIAPRFEIYEGTTMTVPVEYAAIKSGLIHLTKYMAKYFKGENIKVNSISLGGIIDGQPKSFLDNYKSFTLNKGMLEGKDISGTLVYLLTDLSEYVNGQNIIVDDGFTL